MAAQPQVCPQTITAKDVVRATAQELLTKPRFCFDKDVHEVALAYLAKTEPDPRLQFVHPSILVRSGQYFDFLAPETFDWGRVDDIAWGLAQVNRYGGHTKHPYSVAQHSYLASFLVSPAFAFEALMHDAHEAFVGDMMTPLKIICPDYAAVEHRAEAAMRAAFGLPAKMSPEVKGADLTMLAWEYDQLLPDEPEEWDVIKGVERPAGNILPWSTSVARTMWTRRFLQLWVQWKQMLTTSRIDAGLCRWPALDLTRVRLSLTEEGVGG